MAKAWITSGLAVVVVALFWGGYSVGGAGRSSANLAADEARSEAAVARAELGALRERLEESTAELERLRELTGEQAHRIAALGGEIAKRDALTTAAASAAPEGEGEVPVLDDVDWEKLSTLLANRFDILSKMVRGHGQQSYTSEEQEQSLEVLSFILDVAKQARRVSSRPFFDPEFLTSFLEAVHTGTLGLDDEQRGELRGILDAVVESHLVDFDPDAALPSERYRSRSRLLEDFAESTAGILKEPQLERMGVLREFARDVLLGDRISVGIPLNGVRDGAAAPELVAESWLQAFSLDPSRRGALMPIAESFVGEGRRLLELHGAASGSGEVSSEARAAMERAFLDLQITTERRLFDRLSPDERELAGRSRPILLRFHSGNGTSRNVTTGSPF